MIDLAKVRNYYIACGYTDLRLGIDGLAAVVTQQYVRFCRTFSKINPWVFLCGWLFSAQYEALP